MFNHTEAEIPRSKYRIEQAVQDKQCWQCNKEIKGYGAYQDRIGDDVYLVPVPETRVTLDTCSQSCAEALSERLVVPDDKMQKILELRKANQDKLDQHFNK